MSDPTPSFGRRDNSRGSFVACALIDICKSRDGGIEGRRSPELSQLLTAHLNCTLLDAVHTRAILEASLDIQYQLSKQENVSSPLYLNCTASFRVSANMPRNDSTVPKKNKPKGELLTRYLLQSQS
jgi:hypothetical protein